MIKTAAGWQRDSEYPQPVFEQNKEANINLLKPLFNCVRQDFMG